MQTLAPSQVNRRAHPRVRLNPMYTEVMVEPGANRAAMNGHAYDLSETGARIELDEPLPIGETVCIHIGVRGAEFSATGDIRWVNDAVDDPGPRRMALQFSSFHSPADRRRLERFVQHEASAKAA